MPKTFQIPKLTDREIVNALNNVRVSASPHSNFVIRVQAQLMGSFDLIAEETKWDPKIEYILDESAHLIDTFYLMDGDGGVPALQVNRSADASDNSGIVDQWIQHRQARTPDEAGKQYYRLLSLARSELKALDVEVSREYSEVKPWNKYRTLQTQVLNSLTESANELIVKAAKTNADLEQQRTQKFNALESSLRDALIGERELLQAEFDSKLQVVKEQEKALGERAAEFETKESHYVARKQREAQIRDVKESLKEWGLTKGTKDKRKSIFVVYILAIIVTLGITLFFAERSFNLIGSVDAASKLIWWQWLVISLKVVLPFGVFTSFVVSFIRWESSWARQHAEEEFRNRTLLIDIGRSSWLLEAVRDAQERRSELPADLLKELSRNLFSPSFSREEDHHPTPISDVLLQGLASLRVKASDGSEIEATRNGKK